MTIDLIMTLKQEKEISKDKERITFYDEPILYNER